MTCTPELVEVAIRVLAFIGAGSLVCLAVVLLLAWSQMQGEKDAAP
jgi:hypothetical protein